MSEHNYFINLEDVLTNILPRIHNAKSLGDNTRHWDRVYMQYLYIQRCMNTFMPNATEDIDLGHDMLRWKRLYAKEIPSTPDFTAGLKSRGVTAGVYVPRAATGWDKNVGDFTTDGTWKIDGLDLSAIVPAGAVAVSLEVIIKDDAADSDFGVRQNAVNLENLVFSRTQVANVNNSFRGIVAIDNNRLLDYFGDNLAFITISLAVTGWFI